MKKILLATFVMLAFNANAQFILTPDGYRASADTSKTYIVIDIPDGTTETNLAKAKEFVVSSFVSPKDVLSETANMLSVNGVKSKVCKAGMTTESLDVMYTVVLSFRESRIKIDFALISMTWGNQGRSPLPLSGSNMLSMFNKKGEVGKIYKDSFDKVSAIPNEFIAQFKKYMEGSNDNW